MQWYYVETRRTWEKKKRKKNRKKKEKKKKKVFAEVDEVGKKRKEVKEITGLPAVLVRPSRM